jgi:hypothetical protein
MRVGIASIIDARLCTITLNALREMDIEIHPGFDLSFADILTSRMMQLAHVCGPPGNTVNLDIMGTVVRTIP